MRKTPSYLKGLAETRARVAADVERLKQNQQEVAQKLGQWHTIQVIADVLCNGGAFPIRTLP